MAGEVSGTNKFLAIDDGAGGYTQVGGEISSTLTLNGTPVEITNKSAGDFATYLDGEMMKNATFTGEYRLNSDAAFADVEAAFDSKAMTAFLFGDATNGKEFNAQVTNAVYTSNQGEAVNVSITLQISGSFAAVEA